MAGHLLSAALQVPFYYADVDPEAKEAMIAKWKGTGGPIIATSAMGMGVDFVGVVLDLCLHTFTAMEMLQIMGRGGRGGEPATGILITSPGGWAAAGTGKAHRCWRFRSRDRRWSSQGREAWLRLLSGVASGRSW